MYRLSNQLPKYVSYYSTSSTSRNIGKASILNILYHIKLECTVVLPSSSFALSKYRHHSTTTTNSQNDTSSSSSSPSNERLTSHHYAQNLFTVRNNRKYITIIIPTVR